MLLLFQCNFTKELDKSIVQYNEQVRGSSIVKKYFPGQVHDVESMRLMTNTKETLMKVCESLGITCTQKYVADCAAVVDPVHSKRQHFVEWTKDQLSRVHDLIKEYPFLGGYEF